MANQLFLMLILLRPISHSPRKSMSRLILCVLCKGNPSTIGSCQRRGLLMSHFRTAFVRQTDMLMSHFRMAIVRQTDVLICTQLPEGKTGTSADLHGTFPASIACGFRSEIFMHDQVEVVWLENIPCKLGMVLDTLPPVFSVWDTFHCHQWRATYWHLEHKDQASCWTPTTTSRRVSTAESPAARNMSSAEPEVPGSREVLSSLWQKPLGNLPLILPGTAKNVTTG